MHLRNFKFQTFVPSSGRGISNFKLFPGFTLIELLTVITIIVLLITAGTVSWTKAQQKGRDAKRKADLKSVQQALELYFQSVGKYPATSTGKILCYTPYDLAAVSWGSAFTCTTGGANPMTFMNQLPKDPIYSAPDENYWYEASPNPNASSYVLSSKLENANDPDTVGLPCTPKVSRQYCVQNP